MHKKLRTVLIVGLIATVIGVIIGFIGWYGNHQKLDNVNYNHGFKIVKYQKRSDYQINDFKKLNLQVQGADVEIKRGNKFKLETKLPDQQKLTVDQNNDKMSIISSRFEFAGIGFNHENSYITLTVPKDYPLSELKVMMSDGALTINHLKVDEKVQIQNENAGIILNNVNFNQSTVTNSDGGIRLIDGEFNNIDLRNDEGALRTVNTKFTGENKIWVRDSSIVLSKLNDNLQTQLEVENGDLTIDYDNAITQKEHHGDDVLEKSTIGNDENNKLTVHNVYGSIRVAKDEVREYSDNY
ncbi:DUF4097 family beta strand repeat-containing protein [Weissella koreensis]|uniref:DUF4097 domain-containing protein n=1 Tax=Weissella koreensis TaxID=165096 RepID=A0A7H1MKN2_9LACO|nr:DUF4097 family beta strand repeat-containing protein [Weissella koreensis]AVH74815.1 hypothetical protein C4597_01745 [Weissella koreensis]EJF33772.1 hypothetical protein JC2156_05860 [Weissella koreensis KCTC 3621]QGN20039.1 DUF4097 family beta strand repeat protein [Weissella koreensis]QNT64018.1 DUF4097 domain-containing protein [Weissella koreensis]